MEENLLKTSSSQSSFDRGNEVKSQEADQTSSDNFLSKDFAKSKSIDEYEYIAKAIEDALPDYESIKSYAMPHARQWLGPRFFSIWILPILGLKKSANFLYTIYHDLLE